MEGAPRRRRESIKPPVPVLHRRPRGSNRTKSLPRKVTAATLSASTPSLRRTSPSPRSPSPRPAALQDLVGRVALLTNSISGLLHALTVGGGEDGSGGASADAVMVTAVPPLAPPAPPRRPPPPPPHLQPPSHRASLQSPSSPLRTVGDDPVPSPTPNRPPRLSSSTSTSTPGSGDPPSRRSVRRSTTDGMQVRRTEDSILTHQSPLASRPVDADIAALLAGWCY